MDTNEAKTLAEELLAQSKDMKFLDAATEEQIAEFEKSKGIALPSKLKEWLMYADGGCFFLPGGVQIYGVAHKPFINVEDKDKPDDNYIVIGRMSWGEPVVYKKGEEEIDIYDHETGVIDADVRYEDFYAFLRGLYDLLGIGE